MPAQALRLGAAAHTRSQHICASPVVCSGASLVCQRYRTAPADADPRMGQARIWNAAFQMIWRSHLTKSFAHCSSEKGEWPIPAIIPLTAPASETWRQPRQQRAQEIVCTSICVCKYIFDTSCMCTVDKLSATSNHLPKARARACAAMPAKGPECLVHAQRCSPRSRPRYRQDGWHAPERTAPFANAGQAAHGLATCRELGYRAAVAPLRWGGGPAQARTHGWWTQHSMLECKRAWTSTFTSVHIQSKSAHTDVKRRKEACSHMHKEWKIHCSVGLAGRRRSARCRGPCLGHKYSTQAKQQLNKDGGQLSGMHSIQRMGANMVLSRIKLAAGQGKRGRAGMKSER